MPVNSPIPYFVVFLKNFFIEHKILWLPIFGTICSFWKKQGLKPRSKGLFNG
jgi:hypothetical protein